ncbi:MAG: PH domain-containing protein [Acidimicrobiia bacterium]|nr:PH domain-containing protein [Acidimicrobiia bacterium]
MLLAAGPVVVVCGTAVNGLNGLQTVFIVVPLMLLGVVGLRTCVRATTDALHVVSGLRSTSFAWANVRGFVIEHGRSSCGVLAVVEPGLAVRLPIANGGSLLTRRSELEAVCSELEAFRVSCLAGTNGTST